MGGAAKRDEPPTPFTYSDMGAEQAAATTNGRCTQRSHATLQEGAREREIEKKRDLHAIAGEQHFWHPDRQTRRHTNLHQDKGRTRCAVGGPLTIRLTSEPSDVSTCMPTRLCLYGISLVILVQYVNADAIFPKSRLYTSK